MTVSNQSSLPTQKPSCARGAVFWTLSSTNDFGFRPTARLGTKSVHVHMRLLDSLSLFFRKLGHRPKSFGPDERDDLTSAVNVSPCRKGPRRNYASNTPVLKRIGKKGERSPIPSDLLTMDPIIRSTGKLSPNAFTPPVDRKVGVSDVAPPASAHPHESVALLKAVKRRGTVRFSSEPVVEHHGDCNEESRSLRRTASLHPELCCSSGFESIPIPPHLCNVIAACESHFASRDDEIRVKEDDPIRVQRIFPDGWSEGMNWRTGLSGTFPLYCIDPIECERVISEYEPLVVAIMAETEKPSNALVEDMGPRTRSQRSFGMPKEYTTVPKRQSYTTLGTAMMKSPSCSWAASRRTGGHEPTRSASSEPYARSFSRRMGLPLCGGEEGSIPQIKTRIIIPHPDMLHVETEQPQETVALSIKASSDKHEEPDSIASDPNRTWVSADMATLHVQGPMSPTTETESALLSGTPSSETDLGEMDDAVHFAEAEPEVRSGSVTPQNPLLEIVRPIDVNDEHGDMPLSEYLRVVMPRSRSASFSSF
ncbi:hypothetical protein BJ742DRAFT_391247 [Cladochytrium replicatum]|nr:hypothetical protein BJ742DRAFT_391247 [Cladochytrium replicatum]